MPSTKKLRREETGICFWLDSGDVAYSEDEGDEMMQEEKQVK
jgi:hypothetical protein